MKLLSLATLLSTSSATVLLALLSAETLKRGQTYDIDYLLDTPYSLRMELVQKGTEPNIAWTSVKTLFEDVDGKPCNGSYEAVVDDTWPTSENGELYALWISGTVYNGTSGYADLTDWFSVVNA